MPTAIYPDLKDSVVAVTGGSRGLGLAMAKAFVENGAKVIVGSPNERENDEAVAALTREGLVVRSQLLDVTLRASCESFVEYAVAEFGALDVMMCNAGVSIFAPAFETTEDIWRKTIDIDLMGAFNAAVAAARYMCANGGGAIVATSSNAAIVGFEGLSAYGAAKGGVSQLVRSLAMEWGPHNVRVNGVAPGWTDHRMEGNAAELPDDISATAMARTPLRRFGRADEIASAAVFLASQAASFMSGQVLAVDGGYTTS